MAHNKAQNTKKNYSRAVRRSVSVADLSYREWLRPVEAQRFFGIGQSKFWVFVQLGSFPTYRPDGDPKSRTVLVKKSEVEAFLNSGRNVISQ